MSAKEFKQAKESIKVSTSSIERDIHATVGDNEFDLQVQRLSDEEMLVHSDGKKYSVVSVRQDSRYWVAVNGNIYTFDEINKDDDYGMSGEAENSIAAPMPGKVIKIIASEGNVVGEGAPVIIVEAMKMEHSLRAPSNGTVVKILCEEGQQVEADVPLVDFEAEE